MRESVHRVRPFSSDQIKRADHLVQQEFFLSVNEAILSRNSLANFW